MHRCSTILFAFTTLFALFTPRTHAQTDDFSFRRLSIDEGLSQGLVTCIMQDGKGFVWLGTKDGLNRYDGYGFTRYNHLPFDRRTLSHNTVLCLLEDETKQLWIGTRNGLNRFSRDTEVFTRYLRDPANPSSLGGDVVFDLEKGEPGIIWVATQNGLDKYRAESGEFEHFPYTPEAVPTESLKDVGTVLEERAGRVWVGARGGLFYLDPADDRLRRFSQDGEATALVEEQVVSLFEDGSGQLWLGSSHGIGKYNEDADRFEPVELTVNGRAFLGAYLRAINEDSRGRMWLGYHGWPAIIVLNPRSGKTISLEPDPFKVSELSSEDVKCIYRDRNGGMWVGTNGYGANVWYPHLQKFTLHRYCAKEKNGLAFHSVRAIHEDVDGVLWIGGYGGLDRLDRTTGTWTHFSYDPDDPNSLPGNIYTICDDPASGGASLWIGTEGLGVARFDRLTHRSTFYPYGDDGADGLVGGRVSAMCADPSGHMWIGTELGLNHFDPVDEKFTFVETTQNASAGVCALLISRDGFLWAGQVDGGLTRLDRRTLESVTYRHDPDDSLSLSHDHVLCILEAQDGALWIGTKSGGLNRFDRNTETFVHYMQDAGLPNNVVYGALEDESGCIWLSTNQGISRFDPREEVFTNFSVHDGLQSNEFNTAAYYKSPTGEMFFGGIKGFNQFRPEAVTLDPHAPEVVITGMQIANREVPIGNWIDGRRILDKAISETEQVTLAHYDDVVSFSYAAAHFAVPENNAYAYMLQGLEDDWNYVGNRRFVTFTDLRPGRYVFRVKAANNDGTWNEAGTSLAIRVIPPLWGTAWFRVLASILFLSLLAGLHRLRTGYIRKRNRELDVINAKLKSHIREHYRVLSELRESEEKYRVVAQAASEGIITVDQSGKILLTNRSLGGIFGYSADELPGTDVSRLIPSFPEYAADHIKSGGNGVAGESISLTGLHKSGEERLLEVSIGEFRTKNRRLFISLIRDVTARKKLEEQFLQAQKMEAVGRLAGGIAHDLNNLLTVIQGHGELVEDNLKENDPVKEDINEILNASKRAESLTKQLLAFSSRQMLIPRVINVNNLIEEMGRMLRRVLGETIDLSLRLDPGVGNIKADPGQVEQVVMNLVVNARDAMPEGGKITIETHDLDPNHADAKILEFHSEGSVVQIVISDTGSGMDPETQLKIFEPFFTTKSTGEGTGLGLSTVYGIVKQSGGSVWVTSEPGRGSRFTVCLPRVDAPEPIPPRVKDQTNAPDGSETVLVVEDEGGVRKLITDILRRKGYKVIEAKNGQRALEQYELHGQKIDLILTDAVMPGMGGREFVDRISSRLGRTKVLLMSGYAVDMLTTKGEPAPDTNFIHKPFTPVELLLRIRDILTTSDTSKPRV